MSCLPASSSSLRTAFGAFFSANRLTAPSNGFVNSASLATCVLSP